MKNRSLLVLAAAVLLVALAPLPVLADPGPPGFTFPEQPGDHVNTACAAVAEVLAAGRGTDNPTALAIVLGIYFDACIEP